MVHLTQQIPDPGQNLLSKIIPFYSIYKTTASYTLLSLSSRRSREMDGIMLDLQAMKDTLIATERQTYNITAI